MVNELYGGDMNPLVKDINGAFHSITTHLDTLIQIDFGPLHIPDKYHISVEQTERALLGISCKKSSGPDEIPNWMLDDLVDIFSRPVCSICNNSIRTGYIQEV